MYYHVASHYSSMYSAEIAYESIALVPATAAVIAEFDAVVVTAVVVAAVVVTAAVVVVVVVVVAAAAVVVVLLLVMNLMIVNMHSIDSIQEP